MLAALGFAVYQGTKTLIASDVDEQHSSAASSTAAAPSTPPGGKCGVVPTTDQNGRPLLHRLEPTVLAIHDAACRHDYQALIPHMAPVFGPTMASREQVIATWQAEDPDGGWLDVLAETLETPIRGGQGGAWFCHPDGAVAVFPRGTVDRPGMWSDFDPTGHRLSSTCQEQP